MARSRAIATAGPGLRAGVRDVADMALVARAQQDADKEAFAELVRRHHGRIRNMLLRLCGGDAALADDLAQDVFLRAYRALPRFERRAEFGTWLYRIAYNVFLNHTTRTRRFDALGEHVERGRPAPASDEPDGGDVRRDVERAIAELPVHYRAVVVLYYLRDVSYPEMAEILGLPLGTIKTHLFRARARLREIMMAWDEKDGTADEVTP
ncbi:MAG: sigma-70 family RNA polymerase sigma factor [Deltaproteobacteria bacterium]|nr:MAG: sigma-70 family RNA polymerase sigma factor [Deltaproteobacteria bacterium]